MTETHPNKTARGGSSRIIIIILYSYFIFFFLFGWVGISFIWAKNVPKTAFNCLRHSRSFVMSINEPWRIGSSQKWVEDGGVVSGNRVEWGRRDYVHNPETPMEERCMLHVQLRLFPPSPPSYEGKKKKKKV